MSHESMKIFATKHNAQTAAISRLYTPTESSVSRCTTTKPPRERGKLATKGTKSICSRPNDPITSVANGLCRVSSIHNKTAMIDDPLIIDLGVIGGDENKV